MTDGALAGVRVVELCDETGAYCGKLLADLGAEVIKIEPPGGGRQRHAPPFYHGMDSPDASLAFWAHNTSKKSVVLDLATEDGRRDAARLIATADIVVEDRPVGELPSLGLGYERFEASHPALVWTSITGFGQTGPHAGYAYEDLIGQAMGGLVTLAGFPDQPPYQIYGHQADASASIHAAAGTLAALLVAEETGRGQTVDVSAQEAVSMSQEVAMQTWDLQRQNRGRTGGLVGSITMVLPGYGLYDCKDGHVFLMITQPDGMGFARLVGWMREHGMQEDLDEPPYKELCDQIGTFWATQQSMHPEHLPELAPLLEHIQGVTRRFFAWMSAEEAFEESQRRQFFVGLVATAEQLARSPQLRARDWFVRFPGPDGAETEFTGAPYRLSLTPAQVGRPPWLGEHTAEILGALR